MSLDPSMLGLVSWSVRVDTPEQLASRFNEMKMSKIQLALLPMVDQPDVWGRSFEVLQAHGIAVVSGMWGLSGGLINDENWPTNLQRTEAVAKVAQRHGLHLLSSHIGHLPEPDQAGYDCVIQRVSQLAKVLEDHGCRFLFETGPESSPRLCRFLQDAQAAGSPRIGINYDPGNMLIYNSDDPTAALENFLPWIEQCHLKDATRSAGDQARGVETPVGGGDVDWPAFVRILSQAGYQGDLIIERERGDSLDADVAAAVQVMTRLMA